MCHLRPPFGVIFYVRITLPRKYAIGLSSYVRSFPFWGSRKISMLLSWTIFFREWLMPPKCGIFYRKNGLSIVLFHDHIFLEYLVGDVVDNTLLLPIKSIIDHHTAHMCPKLIQDISRSFQDMRRLTTMQDGFYLEVHF